MSKKNNEWLYFQSNLLGHKLMKQDEPIEKFVAFWTGYNSKEILDGKVDIKAIKTK